MKINIKTVWEQELHLAKSVSRTGSLTNDRQPIIITGDLHVFFREIAGIFFYCRKNFLCNYTWWYIPIRTKDYLVQVTIKHHCIVPFLANYYIYIKNLLFAFIYVHHKF